MATAPNSTLPRLAGAAYFLAALLVLVPFVDTLMGVWPPQPMSMFWRFGAGGVFSRGLLEPATGVLLAAGTAVAAGHERTRRALFIGCVLLAVCLVLYCAMFAFDALQMRAQVRPQMQSNFTGAALLAAGRYLLTSLFLVVTAKALRFKASR